MHLLTFSGSFLYHFKCVSEPCYPENLIKYRGFTMVDPKPKKGATVKHGESVQAACGYGGLWGENFQK